MDVSLLIINIFNVQKCYMQSINFRKCINKIKSVLVASRSCIMKMYTKEYSIILEGYLLLILQFKCSPVLWSHKMT